MCNLRLKLGKVVHRSLLSWVIDRTAVIYTIFQFMYVAHQCVHILCILTGTICIFVDEDAWIIRTASSEFGTYHLCEQRRFRRACASAQSRQNLRCSPIQAVNQAEPSDRKSDPWPLWMAGHAQLKFVMTECSKTQIRLTGPIILLCFRNKINYFQNEPRQANLCLRAFRHDKF